jgi:hypothetical protein
MYATQRDIIVGCVGRFSEVPFRTDNFSFNVHRRVLMFHHLKMHYAILLYIGYWGITEDTIPKL